VAQLQILGRGAGFFYMEFRKNGVRVEPTTYHDADVFLATSFDNFVGMTDGTVSADRLFMNGQLRVLGNIAKGAELRHMLRPMPKGKKTR
jgi:putative sterol carrier protein